MTIATKVRIGYVETNGPPHSMPTKVVAKNDITRLAGRWLAFDIGFDIETPA
ncbi:hypothetical protein Poly51_45860 [Rubripirellula tenax]|uniref:Uncharacterized protein n=1 Tax=Rubripirellula tenax TaxID=2528015 RepID=A0A5C6EJU8_9BACT|nr:hypothetical protein Poly51_45860 [Rubripirellula tenax]